MQISIAARYSIYSKMIQYDVYLIINYQDIYKEVTWPTNMRTIFSLTVPLY